MIFIIKRVSDGEVVLYTTSETCIPSDDILMDMHRNGLKAYLDGKAYKVNNGNSRNERKMKNGKN